MLVGNFSLTLVSCTCPKVIPDLNAVLRLKTSWGAHMSDVLAETRYVGDGDHWRVLDHSVHP